MVDCGPFCHLALYQNGVKSVYFGMCVNAKGGAGDNGADHLRDA